MLDHPERQVTGEVAVREVEREGVAVPDGKGGPDRPDRADEVAARLDADDLIAPGGERGHPIAQPTAGLEVPSLPVEVPLQQSFETA